MKPINYIFIILFCVYTVGVSGVVDSANAAAHGRVYLNPDRATASGEIIVKFRSGMFQDDITQINAVVNTTHGSINSIFQDLNVSSMKPVFRNSRGSSLADVYLLHFGNPVALSEALDQLADDPSVEWVEPNYLFEISATPNDPEYPSNQWGLAKIQADLAWNISQGDSDTIIAIIDTGVDYDHPDLAGNIWHNPGEIPNNSIDDDGNGFVDDNIGWDFVSRTFGGAPGEDMGPRDNDPMDFQGHGTHCAGIASAVTNNSTGIAGTGWNCEIMALRAGYKTTTGGGSLADSDTSAALYYAADNGADVVSMSWGGSGSSTTLNLAIEYAYNAGCVLIAAAGNDGVSTEHYPAAHEDIMSVAASDSNDNRASFSNYGSWVDIAAPGTMIRSTMFNDTYSWMQGTSMATPFVAGAAGLILSDDPTLTSDEVKTLLINSGDDISWGVAGPTKRLNVYEALIIQPPDPMLLAGVVKGVDGSWTTVNLANTYESMVVVCSANYDNTSPPGVVRVQTSVSGNSFDVRVDSAGGSPVSSANIHYMVVEEGVYNVAEHGVKMEAIKYTSTLTDRKVSWSGEARSYINSYTNPVVVGQVMSYNDSDWSAFWSRGSSYTSPPNSTLRVGKHVGEDTDTTRLNETVGYIVIEAGSGTIDSLDYVAGLGADTVVGVGDSPPYSYSLSGLSSPSPTAILSQSGMDGKNGSWSVLYGVNPVTSSSMNLAVDEDQSADSERAHTSEQVAYIVFDTPVAPAAPQLFSDGRQDAPIAPASALQNYPNPFNPETWIPYSLSQSEQVTIRIYDMTGQLVRTLDLGLRDPGAYIGREKAAYWDGANESGEPVASGVYFCSIQAGNYFATPKKMVVAK